MQGRGARGRGGRARCALHSSAHVVKRSAGCAQGVVAVKAVVTAVEAGTSVARAAEKAVVMAVEARAAVTMGEAPGVGCSGGDGAGGGLVTETLVRAMAPG
jgi:hypothetical protein